MVRKIPWQTFALQCHPFFFSVRDLSCEPQIVKSPRVMCAQVNVELEFFIRSTSFLALVECTVGPMTVFDFV